MTHLTDMDVQEYALGKKDAQWEEHLAGCSNCQARVANYVLIFQALREAPKPEFEFDTLSLPEPAGSGFLYIILVAGLALLAVPIGLLYRSFVVVFANTSFLVLSIAIIPIAIIGGMQGYALYKNYQKQIALLK